ncbi:unnamed protein product [Oppiella nova]|uniref:C2H2-type domain-containing protein n=1 Tax=Oppiella nova TaxID=334625 RepID=A0A7R9M6Y5_9ACAR|nr:unnamed protein product [Oppiella nova]CAG2171797.1 unnamed protein product [Oppiella nova]
MAFSPNRERYDRFERDRSPLGDHMCATNSPPKQTLADQSRDLAIKVQILTDENRRLSEDIQGLKADNAELTTANTLKAKEQTQAINGLKAELTTVRKEKEKLNDEVKERKKFLEFYKNKKDSEIKTQIQKYEKELSDERKQKQHLEQQLKVKDEEKKKLTNQMKALMKDMKASDKSDEKEKKYRTLCSEYKAVKEKNAKLKTKMTELADNEKGWRAKHTKAVRDVEKVRKEKEDLERRLTDDITAREKSFDSDVTALRKQVQHFQRSSELMKRRLEKSEYTMKKVEEMFQKNVPNINKSVGDNTNVVIDHLLAKITQYVNHSRTELNEKNDISCADVVRDNWTQKDTITANANRITSNTSEGKILCPECPRSFSGTIFLNKHMIAKHSSEPMDTSAIIDNIDISDDE